MLTQAENDYFLQRRAQHEASYLAGSTPRQQSGFGRSALDWERFRRPIVEPIHKDGSFLDVGCANGLLMESVDAWTKESGLEVEVFGLDISVELVELAQRRLPHWHDRIFAGNALLWEPPAKFDFVRTELVYVPPSRRREYVERLLEHFVAPDGKLILCAYGSSRPEGVRPRPLVDELRSWGIPIAQVDEVMSSEHGFPITRVVTVASQRSKHE
jgi:SAM-dependent methyltransferase